MNKKKFTKVTETQFIERSGANDCSEEPLSSKEILEKKIKGMLFRLPSILFGCLVVFLFIYTIRLALTI